MENNCELEKMRSQIEELKAQLDKQSIINEKMMRKAMTREVSWIKRNYYITLIIAVVGVPYCWWVFRNVGMSIGFSIATTIFLAIAAGYSYFSQNAAVRSDLINGSLVEASKKIIRMKKLTTRWFWFGIPAMIGWLSWFGFEASSLSEGKAILIGGIVGGVIGGTIGIHNYIKTRRKVNLVISQIKDLTEES